MSCRKIGGRGRLMEPAIDFARANGFAVDFTRSNHLDFSGHGGRVFGAGTPRSGRAALRAIQRMKALLRESGAQAPH